jgi:hypothetical protein
VSTERLKLVKDFGELRAGMIVVYKPCQDCGGSHRGMLVGRAEEPECGDCGGWLTEPPYHPDNERHLCAAAVKNGRIFRVVDGLEASDSEITKTRKSVRA